MAQRIALVTGGASGFGYAIAHRYANLGAKVAILDLNGEKTRAVAEAIRADKAIGLRAD